MTTSEKWQKLVIYPCFAVFIILGVVIVMTAR